MTAPRWLRRLVCLVPSPCNLFGHAYELPDDPAWSGLWRPMKCSRCGKGM